MKLADADFPAEASTVLARWSTRPAGISKGQVNPLVIARPEPGLAQEQGRRAARLWRR